MVILTCVRLHLVELLEENYDEVEFIKGNLRDPTFCERVSKDVDVIFHCVRILRMLDTKINPLLHVTPNVEMTVNLMEQSWRNKVRKFMFISSNTTYLMLVTNTVLKTLKYKLLTSVQFIRLVGWMKDIVKLFVISFKSDTRQ